MPTVRPGESESQFVSRCVPDIMAEGKNQEQAVAICFSMFEQSKEMKSNSKALTKRVGNQDLPSAAFLVVEDSEKVGTWHLPVKKYVGGTLVADHNRMGAAFASLTSNSRGNAYTGPNKQEALSKLKKLYESEGLDTPTAKELFETTKDFTGAMIALFLPLPAAVALDMSARDLPFYVDRTKARDYHITLAYLGDTSIQDFNSEEINNVVSKFAAVRMPIKGRFSGIGKFDKEEFGMVPIYTNFDSPNLAEFRQALIEELQRMGLVQNPEHGFTPHITLGYMPSSIAELPTIEIPQIDFEIEKITVAIGDERTTHELKQSDEMSEEKSLSSFSVFKDNSGDYRWITLSSNSYQDREKQIVSLKALENDVARTDNDPLKDFGPLRWWHVGGYDLATKKATPGLDIGDCDFRMMRGKFLVESGTFRNVELAEKFKDYDGEISIRFLHPPNEPDSEGVFEKIYIFERSLLPRGKAANPFTAFSTTEEFIMSDKLKEFNEILDNPEMVQELLGAIDAKQKELDPKVKSKEIEQSKSLLSKLKALVSSEEEPQKETPETVTAKEITEAVTAGVVAAVQAINAANEKTAVEKDTEKANSEAVQNLMTRIEKLEGDVKDANTELAAAQKELKEIVGEGGYRASQKDETKHELTPDEKALANADGIADFQKQIFKGQQ